MARKPASRKGNSPPWNPGKHAVWSQRWVDPKDAAPTAILLRHPTSPFTGVVTDLDDQTLRAFAFAYIERAIELADIVPRLELPNEWLQALSSTTFNRRTAAAFGWLPIQWPPQDFTNPEAPADPFVSFRAERLSARGAVLPDQTIILMASERLGDRVLGSEFGLRIVMHAHKRRTARQAAEFDIRITGMSASLPFSDHQRVGVFSEDWSDPADAQRFVDNILAALDSGLTKTLSLDNVKTRGLRISRIDGKSWKCERRGTGRFKSPLGSEATTHRYVRDYPYSFVSTETVSAEGRPLDGPVSIQKAELFADAAGEAQLFPCDPASRGGPEDYRKRRPTRSEKDLMGFRGPARLGPKRNVSLQFGVPEAMRTMVAPRFVLADRTTPAGNVKAVDLPGTGPEIRSDDFAAVSAFHNVEDFFNRLNAYGIDVNAYFRVAKLPLRVAYRSGVEPGPGKDGQVVNARVIPDDWPTDIAGPVTLGQRPGLEMHLALANLRHRGRKAWNGKERSPAKPLGIAADARWIWHEIGHVILMASIGELEFRFAHSAGDALAAIAMDPRSKLASDQTSRGLTFPWVFIPRRHDRCVEHGWSWGGTMHSALSRAPSVAPHPRKAYLSEQILSSSLFRLYRCLGGDTKKFGSSDADEHFRERASHYTIYLILRAVQLMGTTGIVVGNNPDDFVSALTDADIGTQAWNVSYPSVAGNMFERVGGCAHKVIRWAFEAQGLYTPPGIITNAPGMPPPVDVYIADGRPRVYSTPNGNTDYGPGNYLPVSLEWNRSQQGGDPAPAWQAPSAIAVQGNNIRVKVGNRGNQSAANVNVSVWYRKWPKNTKPPTWHNGAGWTQCSPPVSGGQSIAAGAEKTFGPFTHTPPAKRYLILAHATCNADPANTDPATGLPCSYLETDLGDLVPSDNNLALQVLKHN